METGATFATDTAAIHFHCVMTRASSSRAENYRETSARASSR